MFYLYKSQNYQILLMILDLHISQIRPYSQVSNIITQE